MKRYKTNAELKDLAKQKLDGKFAHSLGALLLADMFTRAISNICISLLPVGNLFWDIAAILLAAVVSVFLGILQTGIAYFFLNMVSGQRTGYGQLFYGFQEHSEKSIKISLTRVLPNTICMLPYQIFLLLFLRTTNTPYLVGALISMIIGYVILIPINLALSQIYYLLLDFPGSEPMDIIKTSLKVMKGHKLRLFLLEISFLPLYILCVLSFGIGFLWLKPYMQMTYTLFFLNLMNPDM